MIRAFTTILAGLSLTACSSLPGFDFAELTVRPEYHALVVRGKSRMQSSPGGGPLVNNAAMDVKTFGMRKRDDDIGATISYGDGFSGLEFGYLQVDIDSTERGVLTADFGALSSGTTVASKFFMDEYRLQYTGEVYSFETEDELLMRFGLGALLAHREGKLTVDEDTNAISQVTRFTDDGVPYAAARIRGEYRGVTVTGNYAVTETTFGGDFDGTLQDYSILAAYTLPDQDITFSAGFRWVDLPISGSAGDFAFEHDLDLEGYFFGVEFRF